LTSCLCASLVLLTGGALFLLVLAVVPVGHPWESQRCPPCLGRARPPSLAMRSTEQRHGNALPSRYRRHVARACGTAEHGEAPGKCHA
jgi:hypothetical protein